MSDRDGSDNKPKFKCPKCGHDRLSLIETHAEIGSTAFGPICADENGALIAPSNFDFSVGDVISVQLQCGRCGHFWTPRGKKVVSSRHD